MTEAQVRILKAEMLLKHLTMKDMAKIMGINTSTLYRKLVCKKDFTLAEAKNIAKVLKLSGKQTTEIFFA